MKYDPWLKLPGIPYAIPWPAHALILPPVFVLEVMKPGKGIPFLIGLLGGHWVRFLSGR